MPTPQHETRAEPGPRLRPWSTLPVCLAAEAPLLLIIDEFGKNLEAITERSDADPYLLQQLAEAGQGSGLPIFMLTLQHLSLEDHLSVSESPRRREWIKVSGRFEDIAYVESALATRDPDRRDVPSRRSHAPESDRPVGQAPRRGDAGTRGVRSRGPGYRSILFPAASACRDGPAGTLPPVRATRTHAALVPDRGRIGQARHPSLSTPSCRPTAHSPRLAWMPRTTTS